MNLDGGRLKENQEEPPLKEKLERKESKDKVRNQYKPRCFLKLS